MDKIGYINNMDLSGKIRYSLWTVTGIIELTVTYRILSIQEGTGIGDITIDPDNPEIHELEISEEDMNDIISQCMEDHRDKISKGNPNGLQKICDKYEFSKN